ncbi:MAG: hypothetical protein M8354_13485, partial [Halalkalicoccus sp.]|nr:hypothetical protein [Halalkalicoccus sp.]
KPERSAVVRRAEDARHALAEALELVDLGLLEESITFTEDNKRQRRFRTACNRITLCVGENGLEARLDSDGTVTPFEELLLDDSTLRISLSGTDVRFGIETNGGADAVDE